MVLRQMVSPRIASAGAGASAVAAAFAGALASNAYYGNPWFHLGEAPRNLFLLSIVFALPVAVLSGWRWNRFAAGQDRLIAGAVLAFLCMLLATAAAFLEPAFDQMLVSLGGMPAFEPPRWALDMLDWAAWLGALASVTALAAVVVLAKLRRRDEVIRLP